MLWYVCPVGFLVCHPAVPRPSGGVAPRRGLAPGGCVLWCIARCTDALRRLGRVARLLPSPRRRAAAALGAASLWGLPRDFFRARGLSPGGLSSSVWRVLATGPEAGPVASEHCSFHRTLAGWPLGGPDLYLVAQAMPAVRFAFLPAPGVRARVPRQDGTAVGSDSTAQVDFLLVRLLRFVLTGA